MVHPPLSNAGQHASTNSVMQTLVSINDQVAKLMSHVRTSGAASDQFLCGGDLPLSPDHRATPALVEPLGVLPQASTNMRYSSAR